MTMHWLLLGALLVVAALLTVARHRGPFRHYLSIAALTWGSFAVFAALVPQTLSDDGMGGYPNWTLLPGVAGMVLVAALPPWPVWRFFQPLVGLAAALYWVGRHTWIA